MKQSQCSDFDSQCSDLDTITEDINAATVQEEDLSEVGKLLHEALCNGTVEKALSTPATPVPVPLLSCPGLSARSLKNQVKALLDDALVDGALSIDQTKHLRDLLATYNKLISQEPAAEAIHREEALVCTSSHFMDVFDVWDVSGIHDKSELEKCHVKRLMEESLHNGVLEKTLKEESMRQCKGIEHARELLPIIEAMDSNIQADDAVTKLLEEALNNGVLAEALSTPAKPGPIPLPSCPSLSNIALRKQVKEILDSAVACGALSLQKAEALRDVIATYNMLLSRQRAEEAEFKVFDYSKKFTYQPTERGIAVGADLVNTSDTTVAAQSKSAKLSSKVDVNDIDDSSLEIDLQSRERLVDLA